MRILTIAVTLVTLTVMTGGAVAADGDISKSMLESFEESILAAPDLDRVINAATNNSLKDLSLNRKLISQHDPLFNLKIEGSKITNQRSSGRCWMFAGANTVTPKMMTKLNLLDFKLSEAYLAFWDKLEKSNSFLEVMIDFRNRDRNDRALQMYLDGPMGDGGWFHYFTGLMDKYGLVPASVMPETKQSSATGIINKLLSSMLRKATAEIRRRASDGQSVKKLRAYKQEVLQNVYQVLVSAYGHPPKEFSFRWEPKDDSTKSISEKTFTPMSFYHEFYGETLPEFVAITHNPTLAYDTPYLMKGGRNVFETDDMIVLNLPIKRLKDYTYRALLDSQIVWFACDVGKDNFNDSGIFAVDVYDYKTALGVDVKMSKADRINYHDMSPNHAMVIIGADTAADGTPRKWLVENSWGAKKGNDGYWTMYDSWFDEYVLLIVVEQTMLDPQDVINYQKKPIVIEDWEPFFRSLLRLK